MRYVVAHYSDTANDPNAVCKAHSSCIGSSVSGLLEDENPCPKCLEWLVEQGQLASQRLEHMRSGDDQQDQQPKQ